MKKANILFGVLALCIFGWHVSTACQYLMGGAPYSIAYMMTGIILASVASVHMVINLIATAKLSKKTQNVKIYTALNKEMVVQNMSGYFIIGFIFVHPLMIELTRAFNNETLFIIRFILDVGFYICLSIHLYYALTHLLITFGIVIRQDSFQKWKKAILVILIVLCLVLVLADAMYNLKI